jgi:hypothetical protein
MEEHKSDLKKLKEDYKKIQEKYSLPSFESMNEEFSIEKIAEIETDFLVREVAKVMAEKFSNYMHFVELILNPISSPLFVFSIIKTLGEEEMKRFNEIYKELAKIEVRLIELDVNFSEEKEAIFVKEAYETWKKIKKNFVEIIDKVKSNWDNKSENNTKAYFG